MTVDEEQHWRSACAKNPNWVKRKSSKRQSQLRATQRTRHNGHALAIIRPFATDQLVNQLATTINHQSHQVYNLNLSLRDHHPQAQGHPPIRRRRPFSVRKAEHRHPHIFKYGVLLKQHHHHRHSSKPPKQAFVLTRTSSHRYKIETSAFPTESGRFKTARLNPQFTTTALETSPSPTESGLFKTARHRLSKPPKGVLVLASEDARSTANL